MKQNWYTKISAFIRSRKFFLAILGLFIFESSWIALSSRYPMAFDEDFHLGIIRIYAHHLSPFLASQPPSANEFGAVARDPSYLYHYLMSFPYRLISAMTSDQTIQVIILRFINIAFFASGLVLFRKVLLKTKAPVAWVNTSFLFLVLIPVVPLLAGQINYDNLLFLLTALTLLLVISFTEQLKREKRINVSLLLWLGVLCLLTSLVKYAFLPVFVGSGLYVPYHLRKFSKAKPFFWKNVISGWRAMKSGMQVAAILALLASGGLFFQRFGINVIEYHTPIPACNKVLSTQACFDYGPWDRDYNLVQVKSHVDANPLRFTASWFYGLFERSFFALNGPEDNYATSPPLPVIAITASVVGVVGVLTFLYFARRILRDTPYLSFLLLVAVLYAATLWVDNYRAFLETGQTVAINGRYIFPILLPMLLAISLGYRQLFARWRRLHALSVAVVFLLFLQGGGVITFIMRSGPSWYWSNQTVNNINHDTQKVLNKLVVR